MARVLRLSKSPERGVRDMAKFLLENGRVKGVLTLREVGENGAVGYSLISSADELEHARPLYPLMPVNSGKWLSLLTLRQAATEPIAVVLRPCELRAFVELVKRQQGSTDNLLLISSTCGGVYPLEMALGDNVEANLAQYWEAVKQGEVIPGIRPACKACDQFVPYTADIIVSLLGNKDIDRETVMLLNTDRGEKFVEGMSGQFAEEAIDSAAVERIRSQRETEKQRLFDEAEIRNLGIDELNKAFSKCIGCHNCSKVCAICYCHLCFFDSEASEHDAVYYATQLERRGSVEAFPDTIFYHLVRLSHVSTSCVGCGMCSDVCPASIPLWAISLRVAESVQKAYGYLPGKGLLPGDS